MVQYRETNMAVAVDVRVEWDMVSCEYYLGGREEWREGGREGRREEERVKERERISTVYGQSTNVVDREGEEKRRRRKRG